MLIPAKIITAHNLQNPIRIWFESFFFLCYSGWTCLSLSLSGIILQRLPHAQVCVTVCMRSCWSDSSDTTVRSQLFAVHMLQASPLFRHAESVALLAWEIRQAMRLEQPSMLVLNIKVDTDLGWTWKYNFFLFSFFCSLLLSSTSTHDDLFPK